MATFDEFYASLDPDVGIRGKQFEKFVKWFLKTDPTWASQIDQVWLWNEYPKRWGADCGIDLIFTQKNGKTWAVQSKCISPNNDIKKSEIDSFLSESNDSKIDGRLLIATTDGIGKNAQQVINRQEKQVVCFLLEQFKQSEIVFPLSIEELNKVKIKDKKTPRLHQIEAIEKVCEGLKNTERGQVLMACGTGKTLTSLWIKENLGAKQVLVLVPSLSLLSQTLKEWNSQANIPFKWICVCSDKSIAKDNSEDQWIQNISEIGVPVTSDPLEIKYFLDESGSKVIFSTYQSSLLIVEAQEHHDTSNFDLVIADEAHKCAGKVSDAFGSVLDENKIKASKRLFFTATPRILSKQIKSKSSDEEFKVSSMDNISQFGKVLYQIKFSEAIKKDLLSDYQVLVIGVDDEMIQKKISNRDLLNLENGNIIDAETLALQIALIEAINKYKLKRIISFHSRINYAKDFAELFENTLQTIKDQESLIKISCEYISGKMKTTERNKKLFNLKNTNIKQSKILSNARCLTEGVDLPNLSAVAFINSKQSQVDIIQAVGRAIRKSEQKEKGTIIIPIYISNKEMVEEEIISSNFSKVWQIVMALKSQDDSLLECIDKFRTNLGSRNKITEKDRLDNFIFDLPQKLTSKFSKSISTILVENTSEIWFERYGELKSLFHKNGVDAYISQKYHSEKIGTWIDTQRRSFKLNALSKERIELLNKINFVWDTLEYGWNKNYEELKKYYEINGIDAPLSEKNISESQSTWIDTQRRSYKLGKLPKERIELLNKINFVWDALEYGWNKNYEELKKYYEINGHTNAEKRKNKIGYWVQTQRKNYKLNKLSSKQIQLLEKIKIDWDPIESLWNQKYKELTNYFKEHGNTSVSSKNLNLQSWVGKQRMYYKQNKLTKDKIQLLNDVDIEWDPNETIWEKNFEKLQRFYEENGHSNPKQRSGSLGMWIRKLRMEYRKNNLSKNKIKKLESIKFQWESKYNNDWQGKFDEYKNFLKTNQVNSKTIPPKISDWISRQRKNYQLNKLTADQIQLLESLKIDWDPVKNLWEEKYKQLAEFFKDNGHSNVGSDIANLSNWLNHQRTYYKKNALPQDRVDRLNKLNMVWDPFEYQWQNKFEELKKFYEENGHSNPKQREGSLGLWVQRQKNLYNQNKLSYQKIKLLEDIEFQWR